MADFLNIEDNHKRLERILDSLQGFRLAIFIAFSILLTLLFLVPPSLAVYQLMKTFPAPSLLSLISIVASQAYLCFGLPFLVDSICTLGENLARKESPTNR